MDGNRVKKMLSLSRKLDDHFLWFGVVFDDRSDTKNRQKCSSGVVGNLMQRVWEYAMYYFIVFEMRS